MGTAFSPLKSRTAPVPALYNRQAAPWRRQADARGSGSAHSFRNVNVHNPNGFFAGAPRIQPKLMVNQPGDKHEQEADAMADKVMRMPAEPADNPSFAPALSTVQRKCAACEEEEKVQRKETGMPAAPTASPAVAKTLQSKGQPMDGSTRSFMEQRFGYDFSQVQIHNNSLAHQSSHDIQARAYTHDHHVVFGAGQYQPGTNEGKKLLAHELTHVVQQNTNGMHGIQRAPKKEAKSMPKWRSDEIRHIQRGLRDKGLYKGDTTGVLDEQTVNALDTFFGKGAWMNYSYMEAMSLLKAKESKGSKDAKDTKDTKIAETASCSRGTPAPVQGDRLYFKLDSTDYGFAGEESIFNQYLHTAFWAKEITVHGYASIEGATPEYNFDLACRRAALIRDRLKRGGIDAPINIVSHGPTRAFGDDALNRTVVIKSVFPSLSKSLTIVSWISPDGLQDFSKAGIALTPPAVRPIAAVSMILKCTANKRPPSSMGASEVEGLKKSKEFRAFQHYAFTMKPDGQFNVESSQIPGYTAPSKCGCGDVPPCDYVQGETSPLNHVEKKFPEVDALMKFRVSATEEEEAIKKRPGVPVSLGGLSLDMLPRVPWVWTDSTIGFRHGTKNLEYSIGASKFPTHTVYVDGKQVGEIAQEHPLALLGDQIRHADKPRQTMQEEEAQRGVILSHQNDTVRPGGYLSGEA
ncbi:MAG: DUF4157 domain-containing protein [Williamsia sp.]|nr:DUF4157 domain-containing protein [Williamsia sp.]